MKIRALAVLSLAVFALPMIAETTSAVEHLQPSCIKAGELPLLQVNARGTGELRGYFRRVHSTDWCSVVGTNEGSLSRVVLPRFEAGDEIEYFFILVDGVLIRGRSPRIYRARVTAQCEVAWARHILPLSLSCDETVQAIPSALGAGYSVDEELVSEDPPQISPDSPADQPPPQP
jgi:hypothetical protein